MAGAAAQAGPSIAGLRLLSVTAALAAAPGQAWAGAWPAPETGQAILTLAVGEERTGADLFIEAPLGPRASILGVVRDDQGRTSADLAAKAVVWADSGGVAALQAGVLYEASPEAACASLGGEARALAGYSLGAWFVNVEAAHRQQGDCDARRAEATIGHRPAPHLLAMAQTFLHHDRQERAYATHQLSITFFNDHAGGAAWAWRRSGLQMGLRHTPRTDETALVIGLWRSFMDL